MQLLLQPHSNRDLQEEVMKHQLMVKKDQRDLKDHQLMKELLNLNKEKYQLHLNKKEDHKLIKKFLNLDKKED